MEPLTLFYVLITLLVVLFVYNFLSSKKDVIDNIGVDNQTLVEDKLDNNVIPTTRKWGVWGSIILGLGSIFQLSIISGIIIMVVGVCSTVGFTILLEGFSTLIRLQRKISEKNN